MSVPDIETALAADPAMVAEVHGQRAYYRRRQYLVRWAGWSISESTWEDEEGLFGNPKLAAYLNKKARDLTNNGADMAMAEGWIEETGGQEVRRFNPGMLAEYRKQVENVRGKSTYGKL